ncbi:hypothetical protein QYM46_13410 [Brevibacterium sp. K11IcPPYGO002]|uniref:hypothetical protein n=1 Tax=Brevibacterium sp. K11IcPPYGO002 TaxID=3058837 RepID=UPI003D8150E6
MATFIINQGFDSEESVEAESFDEKGNYTVFYGEGFQSFAIKTARVETITRAE